MNVTTQTKKEIFKKYFKESAINASDDLYALMTKRKILVPIIGIVFAFIYIVGFAMKNAIPGMGIIDNPDPIVIFFKMLKTVPTFILFVWILGMLITPILLYIVYFICEFLTIDAKKPEWKPGVPLRFSKPELLSLYLGLGEHEQYNWTLGKSAQTNDLIELDRSVGNIFAVGTAGMRKITGLIIPNILNAILDETPRMIITDPKGEIYKKTGEFFRKYGYEINVINFLDNDNSNTSIDILETITIDILGTINDLREKDEAIAVKCINDLTTAFCGKAINGKDSYWEAAQFNVLKSLFLWIFFSDQYIGKTMKEIRDSLYSIEPRGIKQKLVEFLVNSNFQEEHAKLTNISDKTFESVYVTSLSCLNDFFENELFEEAGVNLTYNSSKQEINFSDDKIVFFVTLNDTKENPLAGLIIKMLYNISLLYNDDSLGQANCNGPGQAYSIFFLDAIEDIMSKSDIESILTTPLTKDMRFMLILNDDKVINLDTIKSSCPIRLNLGTISSDVKKDEIEIEYEGLAFVEKKAYFKECVIWKEAHRK